MGEEINKYISNMNKIIKSGNPAYLSYVSREYLNSKKNNPIVAGVIESAIVAQSKKPGSVYAILIDNDGTMNFDALYDISKITNVSDFVKNVEALADQDVDFSDLTSDELIIEGMEIAEQIARELEETESQIDLDNVDEETVSSEVEKKSNEAMSKIAVTAGATASIVAIINSIRTRISSVVSRIKGNAKQKSIEKKENKIKEEVKQEENNIGNNSPFSQVKVDVLAAVNKTNSKSKKARNIEDNFNPMDDGLPDDDNDTTDDNNDSNNAQEDDEPDL